MDSAKGVEATFNLKQYALTVNPVGNGSVSKVPDQATLAGMPNNSDLGANSVQLRVQDQAGAFSTQSFSIIAGAAQGYQSPEPVVVTVVEGQTVAVEPVGQIEGSDSGALYLPAGSRALSVGAALLC